MSYELERDWVTKAGLRAACLIVLSRDGRKLYRCGYVEVPKSHSLHGVGHGEPTKAIPRPLDQVFDCHGGLNYSRPGENGYPVQSDGWWFGFDCAHVGDGMIEPCRGWVQEPGAKVRSLSYVEAECERLAAQIVEMFPSSKEAANG